MQYIKPKNQHLKKNLRPSQAAQQEAIPINFENYQKKNLQMQFAWDLLNYEMEVELYKTISLQTIQKLTALYAQGMESYESNGDQRYVYFQIKMNQLLQKPNVIEQMNKEVQKKSEPKIQQKPKTQIEKQKEIMEIKQKKQKELEILQKEEIIKKKVIEQKACNETQAQQMVVKKKEEQQQVQTIINKDMDSQLQRIQERLKKRKNRALSVQDKSINEEEKFKDLEDLEIKPLNEIKEQEEEQTENQQKEIILDEIQNFDNIQDFQQNKKDQQQQQNLGENIQTPEKSQMNNNNNENIAKIIANTASPSKRKKLNKRGQNLSMDANQSIGFKSMLQNVQIHSNQASNHKRQSSNKMSQQKQRVRSLERGSQQNLTRSSHRKKVSQISVQNLLKDHQFIVSQFEALGIEK